MKNIFILFLLGPVLVFQFSCTKDFLDTSPDKSLIVPQKISEFQALLDNDLMYNKTPGITEAGTDDYYMNYATWQAARVILRNGFIWKPDIFEGAASTEWSSPYQQVYYANVVLDGLQHIERTSNNTSDIDRLRGSALFYRAFAFYNLLQVFAPAYVKDSALFLPGIPLRTDALPGTISQRATLEESYQQIITDLLEGIKVLPSTINPALPNRPTRPATFAMLARVFLVMNDYEKASAYADSSLQAYTAILDYNSLIITSNLPFSTIVNPEVLYQSYHLNYGFFTAATAVIDSNLYASYANNDLRKQAFFRNNASTGTYFFKGTYVGNNTILFGGLATDEVYLIKAECNARLGKTQAAMSDLNTLLIKRW